MALEPQSWIRPTQTWRAAKAFPGQCLGTPAKLSGGPLLPERSSQHSLGLESQQPWLTELQATTKSFCLPWGPWIQARQKSPQLISYALRRPQPSWCEAPSSPPLRPLLSQPFQRALSFQSYSSAHADMFRISEAATVIAVASNLDSVCQALPVPTKTLWADSGKQWAWLSQRESKCSRWDRI